MNPVIPAPPLKPRRLWPRFTLRVLLCLVTLVAIGLGIWTHRARVQKDLAERIVASDGGVCYECDDTPAFKTPYLRERLTKLLGQDYIDTVTRVTVRDRRLIGELEKLPKLRTVEIYDQRLHDRDILTMPRCRSVRKLIIGSDMDGSFFEFPGDDGPHTDITDASLAVIAGMRRLEIAWIHGRDLSEAGIRTLASSQSLRDVRLGGCDTEVGSEVFNEIKQFGRIKSLIAWGFRSKIPRDGPVEIARW